jgi:hypothetical protein
MKKILFAALLFVLCTAFKGDVSVNPAYLGTWRCVMLGSDDKIIEYVLYIKPNSKPNKFEAYRKKDADGHPFFTATMLDETHFKASKREDPSASEEIQHKITGYWDGNRLFFDDHIEKSIVNNTAHSTSIFDHKHTYLRWNEETRVFTDSVQHGAMQITGGKNTKEGTTHSSSSAHAPTQRVGKMNQ